MDVEGEMFRWVIGILVTLQSGVIAGVIAMQLSHQKQIAHLVAALDKRLAIQEAKPQVDPFNYTKVMTEFSVTITNLTLRVSEHITNQQTQHAEFRATLAEFARVIEALRRDTILERS